jgi:small-conductance mechanosensitive channel
MHKNHYIRLIVMTVLSFLAMYILMYAMVDSFSNVFSNFNQFYMAGLMAAPMVLIELLLMGAMYPSKKWNAVIAAASVVALVTFWVCIRQQVAISDRQFLKSMIPHHAGAILMCENSSIKDPEIKELCREILSGQRREIDQMKAKLNELR